MKNLSLLLLALVALPVEAADYAQAAAGRTARQPRQARNTPSSPLSASVTHAADDLVVTQPKAAATALTAPHSTQDLVSRSYQECNKGKPDARHRRFERNLDVLKYSEEHIKTINDRQNTIPYVRSADETATIKANFEPTLGALKISEENLLRLSQAKTKDQRNEICKAIPKPEPTNNPTLRIKLLTRSLSEIVPLMAKQTDPYATLTESSRTISNCGLSIIEGSRVSDIDHTATNFARSAEEKTGILETKRKAEFATLLAQLEGYAKTRDLETTSQARLDELEIKANALKTKLLHPASENDRIEAERALLSINREKAGIFGQLEGAKKDRTRKNNAIFVARAESGSLKASTFASYLGAKTADYVSNPQETPLMIDELFSKVLPHLSKEEKRKKAATFLEILMGKTKQTSSASLTWTGQQSVKMTNYPEFSCIVDGKDLSGKNGTEREIVLFGTEGVKPLKQTAALSLIELYKKRESLEKKTFKTIPTLQELHAKTLKTSHWFKMGQEWKREIEIPIPAPKSDDKPATI